MEAIKASPTEQQQALWREQALIRAIEVFGDEQSAKSWLTTIIRPLGSVTPMSLLVTDAGAELVMDELSRIAYGIVT